MQKNKQDHSRLFSEAFPNCHKVIPGDIWQKLVSRSETLELFADVLENRAAELLLPEYLSDLVKLEFYVYTLKKGSIHVPEDQ
jgi:hypothetical protein